MMMDFLTAFWAAFLAILALVYDLPYMHAVFWVTLDILILVLALSLLPVTILILLVLAGVIAAGHG
jgi:hypothetical protein